MALLLLLAIVGAVVDFIYVRRGGVRSTRREKIYIWTILVAVGVSVAIAATLGVNPGFLGTITGLFSTLIFVTWECGRWLVRRKNPLGRVIDKR